MAAEAQEASCESLSFHDHRMIVGRRRRARPQDQDQRDRYERQNHHQLEIVHVANDGGLLLNDNIQRRTARRGQRIHELHHRWIIERAVDRCDVTSNDLVIDLSIADEQI